MKCLNCKVLLTCVLVNQVRTVEENGQIFRIFNESPSSSVYGVLLQHVNISHRLFLCHTLHGASAHFLDKLGSYKILCLCTQNILLFHLHLVNALYLITTKSFKAVTSPLPFVSILLIFLPNIFHCNLYFHIYLPNLNFTFTPFYTLIKKSSIKFKYDSSHLLILLYTVCPLIELYMFCPQNNWLIFQCLSKNLGNTRNTCPSIY